ncbi:hypothetical protein CsSME_00051719 [Camellia sinensis var. sinensis]
MLKSKYLNRDGGWGLHIEGPSTMFGTYLSYVTLRLPGEEADDGQRAVEKGRKWLLDHGGATAITSWGKMWLSCSSDKVLGVFEWFGNNPLPPEIWLIPYVLPFHPVLPSANNADNHLDHNYNHRVESRIVRRLIRCGFIVDPSPDPTTLGGRFHQPISTKVLFKIDA